MASRTRWTRVWVNSWSWWWTGRPGVLQFMGSQRVGHSWATELNWTRRDGRHGPNQQVWGEEKCVHLTHSPLPAEQSHQLVLFLCSHHPYLCATVQKKKKTGAFVILHLCWFLTLLSDSAGSRQNTSSSFSISSLRRIPLFTGQRETLGGILGLPSSLAIFPAGLTTAFKNEHDDHLQYWEGKGED